MNNYKRRRIRFADSLDNDSLTILYSGALKQKSGDESYPFIVNMNFFYLTGIEQDNVYLVIEKYNGKVTETLYIYENDPVKVRWIGAYLEKEEACAIAETANAKYVGEFDEDFRHLVASGKFKKVYLDLEDSGFRGQVDFGFNLKNDVEKISSVIKIADCYQTICDFRAVKDEEEIATFRKAVDITKKALEEVLSRITSISTEYEAQGIFEGSILAQAHCGVSFDTISASGGNAAILHYSSNTASFGKDDMILMDLGACYKYYHADITRTYPTGGKYTPLQRKIYQIVLDCNKMVASEARPGVSIAELQQKTIDFLADGMLNAGLIKEKEEIKKYYFHGISHHIGLDTHDPTRIAYHGSTLQPGMIISDEPGLYIEELKIGVRIEDDLLITEDGCEVLSKDIIKEMDDIETFIANNKK